MTHHHENDWNDRQAAFPSPTPEDVIAFWSEAGRERWFKPDPGFDSQCRHRFEDAWRSAEAGRLASWEDTADGALALVLLLDQMPRNMFRGTADVYRTDPAALSVARGALARGFDQQVAPELRRFFTLPFMHSEELADQDTSVALALKAGAEDEVKWARHHRDIVARFGRFPHRNALLGRASTAAELEWLADENAFKG